MHHMVNMVPKETLFVLKIVNYLKKTGFIKLTHQHVVMKLQNGKILKVYSAGEVGFVAIFS